MFDLSGKVALITGSRRGMGAAHAIMLAEQGATVIVTDITATACSSVVNKIKKAGGKAICYKLDVSNAKEVNSVISSIVKKFGRLDILVNNAGIYQSKPALKITEKDWERTININLKGQFLCAQRAAKEMMKDKWGRIINISSVASGQVGVGIAGGAHYTASKGGVIGLTETLAIEFARYSIQVNAVKPGFILTPMTEKMPEKVLNAKIKEIPMQRMGKAEEVANVVYFYASNLSNYVTGTVISVDGGERTQS